MYIPIPRCTVLLVSLFFLAAGCDSSSSEPDDADDLGSGTLSVMGETWTFDVYHCAFSPEEAGNEYVLFALNGQHEEADLRVE